MSIKKEKMFYIKWAINIVIPLLIALIPTSESFTSTIKIFLIITIFAIVLFATENIPIGAVSMLLPVAYIVILNVPANVAFAAWTLEIPWLILSGFLVTIVLEKTGLLKRLAYGSILLMGGKFAGIIFGMLIVGAVASLVISDVSAKAVLLGALGLSLCKALDLKLGDTEASAIGASALLAVSGPSYFFYTGSTGNLVPFGVAAEVGVTVPTWVEYFKHMFVPQFIYVILCGVAILLVFRVKEPIKSKGFFREELKKLGKISTDEMKITVISLVLIVSIATSSLHGISVGWLFVIAAVVMFLPGINLAKGDDFKEVKWPFILFVTGCLAIGIVSANLGVGAFIAEVISPYISGGAVKTMTGVWALGFFCNFALTPLAAYSAFTGPIVEMVTAVGINPIPVIYTFIHSLEQVIFPYEYALVLIIYGYGMMSYKNIVKYSAVKAVLSIVCILLIFIPYWKLIGLL